MNDRREQLGAIESKLKALVHDWRDEADEICQSLNGNDDEAAAYYDCANKLEDLLGERPPLHLTPRPPDRQPHSAVTKYRRVEDTPPL